MILRLATAITFLVCVSFSTPAHAVTRTKILYNLNKNMAFPYVFQDGKTTYLSYSIGEDALNQPSHEYRSWRSTNGGKSWQRSYDNVSYNSALRVGSHLYTLDYVTSDSKIHMTNNGKPFIGYMRMGRKIPPSTRIIFNNRVNKIGAYFYATGYSKISLGSKPKGTPPEATCAPEIDMTVDNVEAEYYPGHGIVTSLFVSRDGVNWNRKSDISRPAHLGNGKYYESNESSMVQLPSGRLYSVLRAEIWDWYGCRYYSVPMRFSYSKNLGASWSAPSILRIKGKIPFTYAQPTIMRSGNSIYLGHGRPNNYLAKATSYKNNNPVFSSDTMMYSNRAVHGFWAWGSSGYTALAVLNSKITMLVDNCGTSWSCPARARFTTGRFPAIVKVTN